MSDPYLGTTTLMRTVLDALLPEGSAWRPAPGRDLDNLLHAVGDSLQGFQDFAALMDSVRDPATTPYLDELEREYGITPDSNITEAKRRAILADRKFMRQAKSTKETLQGALDNAGLGIGGLGLLVFANDPPVDPGTFIGQVAQCFCGGPNAYCGYFLGSTVQSTTYGQYLLLGPGETPGSFVMRRPYTSVPGFINQGPPNADYSVAGGLSPQVSGAIVTAVCGLAGGGGLWVVNGDLFTVVPNFEGCGFATMVCGYVPIGGTFTIAVCGHFASSSYLPIPVVDPPSTSWPLVFFIATGATYDVNGAITSLTMGNVPNALRFTLIEIIMRWKPAHCWAVLMANFT